MILTDISGLTFSKNWTFGLKSAVLIVKYIDEDYAPTEVNNIILSYPPTTQIMVDSKNEILWDDNSGVDLGHHRT